MSFSTSTSISNTSLYFHRVREGEDLNSIAAKHEVKNIQRLIDENPGVKPKPGDIVVINLKTKDLA